MLIIDDTIFLHLHKCAGTSMGNTVEKYRKYDIQYVSTHNSLNTLPDEFKHFPVVSLVRNPLTWYISWYTWSCKKHKEMSYYNTPLNAVLLLENGVTVDIHTFIDRATNLPRFFKNNPEKLEILRDIMLSHRTYDWWKAIIGDLTKLSDIKFNGSLYELLIKGIGVLGSTTYRIEDQKDIVIEMLKLPELGVTEFSRDNVSYPSQNASKEDLEKIIKADDKLFDLFGYEKIIT